MEFSTFWVSYNKSSKVCDTVLLSWRRSSMDRTEILQVKPINHWLINGHFILIIVRYILESGRAPHDQGPSIYKWEEGYKCKGSVNVRD